jgi:type III secretory pathway component EscU
MIELFVLAVIALACISLVFKLFFLFIGLIFSGIGFFLRFGIIAALAFFCFPWITAILGGLLSSGILVFLVILGLLSLLLNSPKKPRYSREYHDDTPYREYRGPRNY